MNKNTIWILKYFQTVVERKCLASLWWHLLLDWTEHFQENCFCVLLAFGFSYTKLVDRNINMYTLRAFSSWNSTFNLIFKKQAKYRILKMWGSGAPQKMSPDSQIYTTYLLSSVVVSPVELLFQFLRDLSHLHHLLPPQVYTNSQASSCFPLGQISALDPVNSKLTSVVQDYAPGGLWVLFPEFLSLIWVPLFSAAASFHDMSHFPGRRSSAIIPKLHNLPFPKVKQHI